MQQDFLETENREQQNALRDLREQYNYREQSIDLEKENLHNEVTSGNYECVKEICALKKSQNDLKISIEKKNQSLKVCDYVWIQTTYANK